MPMLPSVQRGVGRTWMVVVLVVSLAALAAVGAAGAAAAQKRPQRQADVTTKCLITMLCTPGSSDVSWPTAQGNVMGQRYSPLTQINRSNVKGLRVAWTFSTKVLGTETYPVIVGDRAYVTTSYGNVYAVNAATGQKLWSFDATPSNKGLAGYAGVHGFPNRGVAVGDGKVFVLTANALLVALDENTGRVLYEKGLGDPRWLTESAPAFYYKGIVFVGSAGAESGQRGFEAAYSARTGKQLWRHYNVPPYGQGWMTQHHGGGTVWMNPTIDPKTDRVFIGTANPAPDFYGNDRPGPNKWTDSILALNMKTGKMIWGFQETAHDLWDWDQAAPPTLFPTKYGLTVGGASKSGYWYEVSAATGEQVTAPSPFLKIDHPALLKVGDEVTYWPGPTGGWGPVPYSPQTHSVFVAGSNLPIRLRLLKQKQYTSGDDFLNGVKLLPSGVKTTGVLYSFDVESGARLWKKDFPVAVPGGTTATAGGLVFVGIGGTGRFQAYDAKTGKLLWQHKFNQRIDNAASVYSVNGKEYVLIGLGGTSIVTSYGGYGVSPATFVAFALP